MQMRIHARRSPHGFAATGNRGTCNKARRGRQFQESTSVLIRIHG